MHHFILAKKDAWISSGSNASSTGITERDQNYGRDQILEVKKNFYNDSFDSSANGGIGGYVTADGGTTGYGYKYHFENALSDDKTIVRPPLPITPTVFELRNPNQNIQGRVR